MRQILSFLTLLALFNGETIYFEKQNLLATEKENIFLARDNEITIPIMAPIKINVKDGKTKAQTTGMIHVSQKPVFRQKSP